MLVFLIFNRARHNFLTCYPVLKIALMNNNIISGILLSFCIIACTNNKFQKQAYAGSAVTANYNADSLPLPFATKSTSNFSRIIGWKKGETPIAPAGFSVTRFADSLDHPRWIYVMPNGDVLIAESNTILSGIKKIGAQLSRKIKTHHYGESANRITLFRDKDGDGIPEQRTVFLQGLNQPLGMLVLGNHFYVANTDGLLQYDYKSGDMQIKGAGKKIRSLPAGGYNNHWTRNIIANKDSTKIFISVGSGSNSGENGMENEIRRANILEINLDGSGEKIVAGGLRNPVGMALEPASGKLWTVVNERDNLGDELVPDYLTEVKEGAFYGWPYAYFGAHEDPRIKDKRPDLVSKTVVPDVALGSHTASLGLIFYTGSSFPAVYRHGAFVAQHGSWNRSVLSGYKVVFVPFANGKPNGPPQDFLTGFVSDLSQSEVHGRPVGMAQLQDGSIT